MIRRAIRRASRWARGGDDVFLGPSGGVLVLGEAPSRRDMKEDYVRASTFPRLAELARLTVEEFGQTFARANVLETFPGGSTSSCVYVDGKIKTRGDYFPLLEGREEALQFQRLVFPRFSLVILLGRRVEAALRIVVGNTWFTWFRMEDVAPTLVVVPHPSRASSCWNDPALVDETRDFWVGIVEEARRRTAGSFLARAGIACLLESTVRAHEDVVARIEQAQRDSVQAARVVRS